MQHIPDFEKDLAAKQELEQLSPALFQIHNQAQRELPKADDMPADYFDNLFDNVWSTIQTENSVQTFTPNPAPIEPEEVRLAKRPTFWYAAAASVAILLTCGIALTFNNTNDIQSNTPLLADNLQPSFEEMLESINKEEIANYLLDSSDDLDLPFFAVSENAYKAMSKEIFSDIQTDETFHWDY